MSSDLLKVMSDISAIAPVAGTVCGDDGDYDDNAVLDVSNTDCAALRDTASRVIYNCVIRCMHRRRRKEGDAINTVSDTRVHNADDDSDSDSDDGTASGTGKNVEVIGSEVWFDANDADSRSNDSITVAATAITDAGVAGISSTVLECSIDVTDTKENLVVVLSNGCDDVVVKHDENFCSVVTHTLGTDTGTDTGTGTGTGTGTPSKSSVDTLLLHIQSYVSRVIGKPLVAAAMDLKRSLMNSIRNAGSKYQLISNASRRKNELANADKVRLERLRQCDICVEDALMSIQGTRMDELPLLDRSWYVGVFPMTVEDIQANQISENAQYEM